MVRIGKANQRLADTEPQRRHADRAEAVRFDSSEPPKWLDDLAEALIARHLAASIPDPSLRGRSSLPESYMEMSARKMRSVAVVGAGASDPHLARGDKLVAELRDECGVPQPDFDAELARQERVFGQDPEHFETQLVALSQTPYAAALVREKISRRYRVRHPTILSYELLAHLLKHRFLDAIISFNFDELLDQSLADEIGQGEYATIVSERDCEVESNADSPNYVPLHIKMHGTASEQDSLRFTRESYYTIPRRIIDIIRALLHTDECVIANVGSGMTGFDFQYLLREPERLFIFDLSPVSLRPTVRAHIADERAGANVKDPHIEPPNDEPEAPDQQPGFTCDEWMSHLVDCVDKKASRIGRSLVKTRSVNRHHAVVHLLGPKSRAGQDLLDMLDVPDGRLDTDAVKEYHKKRTILELAFAMVKARGLLAVGPLAVDRAGTYYERYSALAGGQDRARWADLCAITGLVETEDFPDFLSAAGVASKTSDAARDSAVPAEQRLTDIDLSLLTRRILRELRNPADATDAQVLRDAFRALQKGTEIELHSRDDRVCAKTFVAPITLKTRTALEAYTQELLNCHKSSKRAYFVSETGEWLLEKRVRAQLEKSPIRIILAFETEVDNLKDAYPKLKHKVTNPWWHNRHMTIVDDGDSQRGIYFLRRQRSPYVTPVYLGDAQDVQRLFRGFEAMWQGPRRRPQGGKH
jgi:hypothetical protein